MKMIFPLLKLLAGPWRRARFLNLLCARPHAVGLAALRSMILGPSIPRALRIALLALAMIPSAQAAHSDIILSRSNGVLRVDATVHTSDVRDNEAAGNGTVWATDNPGFAGSRFAFQDHFWFDITGPLRPWDGTNWRSANLETAPWFLAWPEHAPHFQSSELTD
jgi:hypothetical protein